MVGTQKKELSNHLQWLRGSKRWKGEKQISRDCSSFSRSTDALIIENKCGTNPLFIHPFQMRISQHHDILAFFQFSSLLNATYSHKQNNSISSQRWLGQYPRLSSLRNKGFKYLKDDITKYWRVVPDSIYKNHCQKHSWPKDFVLLNFSGIIF